MPEHWIAARGRVLAGLFEATSVYAAVCFSCGGLAVLASYAAQAHPLIWFPAGFALPIGPMYLYLAADRVLEQRLARWKKWRDEGLIGVGQHEQLRRDALAWDAARHRFGKLAPVEAPGAPEAPPEPAPPA